MVQDGEQGSGMGEDHGHAFFCFGKAGKVILQRLKLGMQVVAGKKGNALLWRLRIFKEPGGSFPFVEPCVDMPAGVMEAFFPLAFLAVGILTGYLGVCVQAHMGPVLPELAEELVFCRVQGVEACKENHASPERFRHPFPGFQALEHAEGRKPRRGELVLFKLRTVYGEKVMQGFQELSCDGLYVVRIKDIFRRNAC